MAKKQPKQVDNYQEPVQQKEVKSPYMVPVKPQQPHIQLTPIVQPIAFVPYSTQEQPLYTFDDQIDEQDEYIEEEAYAAPARRAAKKSVSAAAILLIIFTLLLGAVFIVGNFVDAIAEYTAITVEGETQYNTAYALIDGFVANLSEFSFDTITEVGTLIPVLLLGASLFGILTLLFALIGIKKKGTSALTKIVVILLFACVAFATVFCIINDITAGIGLFVSLGISIIMLLCALLFRKERR